MTMDQLSSEPTTDTTGHSRQASTVVVSRRTLVVLTLTALGLIGASYGVGRLQGMLEVTQIQSKAAQHSKLQAAQTSKLQTELSSAHVKLRQLEARRQLHMALMALEQRNFGIAQQRVKQSGQLLVDSRPPSDGELARLARAMAAKKLVATENLATQRRELLAWADKIDTLVPPASP